MADLRAIHSVGHSLLAYLESEYDQLRDSNNDSDNNDSDNNDNSGLRDDFPDCQFRLFSGKELDGRDTHPRILSLFLYRVIMNEHLRSSTRSYSTANSVPLSVDLHYLMTIWAPNAMEEQYIFAWAVRQLHLHPVFDASTLLDAGWAADEVIHVVPAELSNEDLMRIWDALQPTYHLSKAYIARAVRIDPDEPVGSDRPVVATQIQTGKRLTMPALGQSRSGGGR